MSQRITLKESVFVAVDPDSVWNFTQDYDCRTDWDRSIQRVKVVQLSPGRVVEIRGIAGLSATIRYKQEDRPHKTSLVLEDLKSPFFEGGGGSWKYERHEGGTLWTQTNTLLLRDGFLFRSLKPLLSFVLQQYVRNGMRRAKQMMESRS